MFGWKELTVYLTGLTGTGVLVIAGIASYLGQWIWTRHHLEIIALKDQQIAEHRERAEFWQRFALRERGLTEAAIKTTQVAVEKMEGAST